MDGPRYSESYRRMEDLIRRNAPRFLTAGGGALEREQRRRREPSSIRPPTKITIEMKRKMVIDYGVHGNITQIARDLGVAPKTVLNHLVSLGVHKKRVQ